MDEIKAKAIIDKIFFQIFGTPSPYSLDEILANFAFDLKLPQKVQDSITGEETWSESINGTKFITQKNMETREMIKKYEVKLVPTTVFKDKDGNTTRRIEGNMQPQILENYLKEITNNG